MCGLSMAQKELDSPPSRLSSTRDGGAQVQSQQAGEGMYLHLQKTAKLSRGGIHSSKGRKGEHPKETFGAKEAITSY